MDLRFKYTQGTTPNNTQSGDVLFSPGASVGVGNNDHKGYTTTEVTTHDHIADAYSETSTQDPQILSNEIYTSISSSLWSSVGVNDPRLAPLNEVGNMFGWCRKSNVDDASLGAYLGLRDAGWCDEDILNVAALGLPINQRHIDYAITKYREMLSDPNSSNSDYCVRLYENDCNMVLAPGMNIPGLDITSPKSAANYMFANCPNLVAIPQVNTQNINGMNMAFEHCRKLRYISFKPGSAINFPFNISHSPLLTYESVKNILTAASMKLVQTPFTCAFGNITITDRNGELAALRGICVNKNWNITGLTLV